MAEFIEHSLPGPDDPLFGKVYIAFGRPLRLTHVLELSNEWLEDASAEEVEDDEG